WWHERWDSFSVTSPSYWAALSPSCARSESSDNGHSWGKPSEDGTGSPQAWPPCRGHRSARGVVCATWTSICLSGGGAVRESPPSPALEHDPVPPVSHALLRAPGWGGGRGGPPCPGPSCRLGGAWATPGTAGK